MQKRGPKSGLTKNIITQKNLEMTIKIKVKICLFLGPKN